MIFSPEVAEGQIDGVDLRKENKTWLTNKALFNSIESGLSAGMRELVLYHLTGFPGETDGHVEAFARMSREIIDKFPQLEGLRIIAGCVFPTVGTKLERAPQITFEEAKRRWLLLNALLSDEVKIEPQWILDMPHQVRYNKTQAGADVYFCQAYYHRADQRMGEALSCMSQQVGEFEDVFTLGTAEHEEALSESGIDVMAMFAGEDIVTSDKIDSKRA